MPIQFSSGIAFSGILFSLLSLFFIQTKYKNDNSNRFLTAIFICFLISSTKRFLAGLEFYLLSFDLVTKLHIFLFGPLFFLLIKSLKNATQKELVIKHFYITALYLLFVLMLLVSNNLKDIIHFPTMYFLIELIALLINLVYFIATLRIHQRTYRFTFFFFLFGLLYFGWSLIILGTLFKLKFIANGAIQFTWAVIPFSAFIYLVMELRSAKRTLLAQLSKNKQESLFHNLKKYLLNNSTYLNPKLKLSEIAEKLDTKAEILNAICEEKLALSFNSYLNQLRIEAFVQIILKKEETNLTLFSIAENCGFSSKATFYQAFKKAYKTTPKKYFSNK